MLDRGAYCICLNNTGASTIGEQRMNGGVEDGGREETRMRCRQHVCTSAYSWPDNVSVFACGKNASCV